MTMTYTPTIPPPHPNKRAPKFTLPKLSCDAHCHIFGSGAKYSHAPDRSYTPLFAPEVEFQQKILVDNPARLFGFGP